MSDRARYRDGAGLDFPLATKRPCIYALCHTPSDFTYLQLVRFDVPAAVRVVLPPGLKQNGDVNEHAKSSPVQLFTVKNSFLKKKKKSTQETLKNRFAAGCLLTRRKYRICQRWIPKCLQHSLMFSSRKLCSIYNVWRSENSFTTESSWNMAPRLETLLIAGPSLPAVSTLSLREEQMPDGAPLPR